MQIIPKPPAEEYSAHAAMYIDLLQNDGNLLERMQDNFFMIKDFILALPAEKLLYRYAKDKWTIKEVLVHMVDDERIYAYRALWFCTE